MTVSFDFILHGLLAIAFFLVGLGGDYLVFICICVAALLCLGHRVFRLLLIQGELRILLLAANMTGAWTLYGQCLSLLTFYKTSHGQDDYSKALSVEWPYLSYGLSLVFLYTATFILFSCINTIRRAEIMLYKSILDLVNTPRMLYLCSIAANNLNLLFIMFFSFLILSGGYGLRGAGTAIDGRLSWWAPIATIGLNSVTITAPFSLNYNSRINRFIIPVLALAVAGYVAFLSGRRILLYFVIGTLFSNLILCPHIFRERIRFKTSTLFILLFSIFALDQLTEIFQYLRSVNLVTISPENILEVVSDYYSSSDILEINNEKISENLLTRSLLHINFHGVLNKLTILHIDADFRDLISSLTFSLPHFLATKTDRFTTSDAIGEIMGFSTDYMISPPLSAFVSFGLAGFVIYPLIQIFFLLLLLLIISFSIHKLRSPYLFFITVGYIVQLATSGFPDSTTHYFFRPVIEVFFITIPFFMASLFIKKLAMPVSSKL
jgi:hypothetical protein